MKETKMLSLQKITAYCFTLLILLSGITPAQTLPKSIYQTNEAAEDLFDYALSKNVKEINYKIVLINKLYDKYRSDAEKNSLSPQLLDFYSLYVSKLNSDLKNKNYSDIASASNQITGIGAEFTKSFSEKIPWQIARLDYLGRELILGEKEKNNNKINRRLKDIAYIWKSVKPEILKRKGLGQSEKFESEISKLNKNVTNNKLFMVSVNKYLDLVDELEKLF